MVVPARSSGVVHGEPDMAAQWLVALATFSQRGARQGVAAMVVVPPPLRLVTSVCLLTKTMFFFTAVR